MATGRNPVFAQTMLRVKDPKVSVKFYEDCGMKLINKMDFPNLKFSLWFMAFTDEKPPSFDINVEGSGNKNAEWLFSRSYTTLELTHNWGTETDPEFKGYHNGNTEPRGFGHIGWIIEDLNATVEKLRSIGTKIVREPGPFQSAGSIAFVADPDGYWIELIQKPTTNQ
eukprot:TRINITY_DN293_c0_g1_i1.p1 TRINITY_DN293_c0_g1~~TRINITY_DN293_c0_g1_i1.p1  ORF type:complete len:183 (-),score=50.95 TRINITY_DN293_c0_g1_i1:112-615(-)